MNLTDKQIENWRIVLSQSLGFIAFYLPRMDIELFAKIMQDKLDEGIEKYQFCTCDETKNGETIHVDGKITCNKCHKERVQEKHDR